MSRPLPFVHLSLTQAIASPGGRISVAVLLLVMAIIAALCNIAWADKIAIAAIAVLVALLGRGKV